MEHFGTSVVALVTAAIGLAIVAVIVSKNANTSSVIQAASSGLGTIIGAAVAPVTGSGTNTTGSNIGLGQFSNLFGGGSFAQ